VQLIITDYVGRIDTFDPRLQEWQVLYNVVKAQKQMAQNLECACMVLIQLNPDETLQGAKRMENESDLMLKLLPVSEDEVKAYEQEKGIMYENWNYKLEIKKNRDGVAGNSIPLFFNKPTQKITQAVRISK
jgi:replicative DNA helicase